MSENVHPLRAGQTAADGLPHCFDVERALLGALLIKPEQLPEVAQMIQADDFFATEHREVFTCLLRVAAEGKPTTPITVAAYLGVEQIAGLKPHVYLVRLIDDSLSWDAAGYAKIVKEFSDKRLLVTLARDLATKAADATAAVTASALIDDIDAQLLNARARADVSALSRQTAQEGTAWALDRIAGLRAGLVASTAISTGIKELDRATNGGFQRGQLWLLAGRPGMGKAQPLNARVHTPFGWRLMGEMAVGTAISSVDGDPSRVVGVFEQGVKPVYRVRLSDGRETRCCAEHLWEVRYREWPEPRVLDTARLIGMLGKARYRNRLSVRMHDGAIGATAAVPLDPWLLGVILGDGGLSTDTVRLSLPDVEIRNRVAALLPHPYALSHQGGIDYLIVNTAGGRNEVRAVLAELALIGSRAETKHVPRIYLDGDRSQRLAILQGLLDTDGWVERQGSVRFSSASPQLAADVVELARSLGLWAKASTKAAYPGSHAAGRVRKLDAHQVCITGQQIAEVFTLPRKADRLKDRSWFRALTIESITLDGEEPCRCIAVSHPTRLYVTDDHVVTHNTVAMTSLSRKAAKDHGVLVFQCEVTRDQQWARYLADLSYVANNPLPFGKIMAGVGLTDEDWWRLEDAGKRLERLHLTVECEPGVSVARIAATVKAEKRRLASQGVSLGVVFIDYLKFIEVSDRYQGNRVLEIGEISGSLKRLAKAEDVCIVLLAQLNRQVEAQGRTDKRPTNADLRDSGELEQDADTIIFLYREAFYLEQRVKGSTDPDLADRLFQRQNALELILGKNRSGPCRTIDAWCDVAHSAIASQARGL